GRQKQQASAENRQNAALIDPFGQFHPPSQDGGFQAGRGSLEDDPANVEGNGRMGSQIAGLRAKKSTPEEKIFDKL
ncbi:MAG: hypothetical protein LBU32_13840, partial [Clostridiales bacterium]|nr:hypothetical protein [Clostridiales bacterium]